MTGVTGRQYSVMDVTPTAANARQVGGSHYKDLGIEPWAALEAWLTPEEFRGYLRGCAIKYLARANLKGGSENFEKAAHCLQKHRELLEKEGLV
jgi:hypothetical protein